MSTTGDRSKGPASSPDHVARPEGRIVWCRLGPLARLEPRFTWLVTESAGRRSRRPAPSEPPTQRHGTGHCRDTRSVRPVATQVMSVHVSPTRPNLEIPRVGAGRLGKPAGRSTTG
jgi:hypothetical protein